ncbi:MAG: alpha/beta fold hydrolase [Acetobacteraceae bacterium]|nr:alpha/beta fold hydrolase [Acetobacteraceae bacterium]MDW8398061.1 alpha/beta fold hydrolase [Acetobacteraceae bacterium]
MRLACTTMGEGPPVVFLHGLFGQGRNFAAIARPLAARARVLLPDLRNHGSSSHAPGMAYPDMAADVAETMEAEGVAEAAVIGHSMGGKVAMALALAQPARVSRLLISDIAPRPYAGTLARYAEAMRALPLAPGLTRAAADAALAPAVPDPAVRAFLLHSLRFDTEPPSWRVGLEQIGAGMADILGFPDFATRYEGPALFVSGERSDYITPADRPLIRALFPRARFATVKGAGHWVHADQPEAFRAVVEAFLAA